MDQLQLIPLADNPTLGAQPLQWSLDLWGSGNPWFSPQDWVNFYEKAASTEYEKWDLEGRDQEQIYLAIQKGEVVGVISLVDFDDLEDYRHFKPWVAAFIVDPQRRGSGLGSAMLAALEEKARNFGIERLYLWTEDKGDFYTKRGYELLEHRAYPELSIDILSKPLID